MNGKLDLGDALIHIFREPQSRDEAILQLVSLLESRGYVKDSFGEAVLEREKVFPTGLPTEPIGIAIPHTDAEHVKRGAIAVGVLPAPVQFTEMGCEGDRCVDVHAIVVLAIHDPDAVTGVLRELALCFQDGAFLTALKEAETENEILGLFLEAAPNVVCAMRPLEHTEAAE